MRPFKVSSYLLAALGASLVAVTSCSRVPALEVVAAGGDGPPTLVLLHGFGSSAAEWLPFTHTIEWPTPGRFVFPQGPDLTTPPAGPIGGRAWWPLELRSLIPEGGAVPDLSPIRPPGLEPAAHAVEALLKKLSRAPGEPIVLGGFSQGAMVASEVAFRSDVPIEALVLLSGTPVDESLWQQGYGRRRGLAVFVAHGRSDPVLPFSGSERMQRELAAAGHVVTWHPFDGGHEIPAEVVAALNQFLRELHLHTPEGPAHRPGEADASSASAP
jgi:phospholipase/carboxylesterase